MTALRVELFHARSLMPLKWTFPLLALSPHLKYLDIQLP